MNNDIMNNDIMNNGIMFGEELCGFYQEIYIILWGKKKIVV